MILSALIEGKPSTMEEVRVYFNEETGPYFHSNGSVDVWPSTCFPSRGFCCMPFKLYYNV